MCLLGNRANGHTGSMSVSPHNVHAFWSKEGWFLSFWLRKSPVYPSLVVSYMFPIYNLRFVQICCYCCLITYRQWCPISPVILPYREVISRYVIFVLCNIRLTWCIEALTTYAHAQMGLESFMIVFGGPVEHSATIEVDSISLLKYFRK